MSKLKIRKGDKVKVITGKDSGKIGDVIKVFPKELKLLISGVNQVKKHTKPTSQSEGGINIKEMPIHISNVAILSDGEISKIGYKFEDEKKVRVAKKTGKIINSGAK